MAEFIIYSLVVSVVLTILVNLLPLLFPNAARKAQKKIAENGKVGERVVTACSARVALPANEADNPWKRRGERWKPVPVA